MYSKAGWAPGPVWKAVENLYPSGFDPRTVETVARSYTDRPIPAHNVCVHIHTHTHTCIHTFICHESSSAAATGYNQFVACPVFMGMSIFLLVDLRFFYR